MIVVSTQMTWFLFDVFFFPAILSFLFRTQLPPVFNLPSTSEKHWACETPRKRIAVNVKETQFLGGMDLPLGFACWRRWRWSTPRDGNKTPHGKMGWIYRSLTAESTGLSEPSTATSILKIKKSWDFFCSRNHNLQLSIGWRNLVELDLKRAVEMSM